MANAIPSIACLGVIGRHNNPLHITIFPSHDASSKTVAPLRTPLQFSLLLSSTLDIFESRSQSASSSTTTTGGGAGGGGAGRTPVLSGDFGLLHAVDERLAAYGFETNTGVKFVAVVDMRGRLVSSSGTTTNAAAVGLRDTELRVVFRAMQTAYIKLLQNPFYDPDEQGGGPMGVGGGRGAGGGAVGKRITSRKFAEEMRKIGEGWSPGVTSL